MQYSPMQQEISCNTSRQCSPHLVNYVLCMDQPGDNLMTAAKFLNLLQGIGAEILLLINVGDCSHSWTENDLGVIFEEIDLREKM